MNKVKLFRYCGLCALILVASLFGGCAGIAKTSRFMADSTGSPMSPPPGKTLVCIHRPRAQLGNPLYTKVWDGTKFIADLGNGHSTAYVCDPGDHYFMNTSAQAEGCVQAHLLPDKTYDLWLDTIAATFIVSFKIKPVDQNEKMRSLVATWTRKNRWVEPAPAGEAVQSKNDEKGEVDKLIDQFATGARHGKLQQLAADDHR